MCAVPDNICACNASTLPNPGTPWSAVTLTIGVRQLARELLKIDKPYPNNGTYVVHGSDESMAELRASSSSRMVEALLQSITDDPVSFVRRLLFA